MQRSKLIALAILLISAISACTKKTDNLVISPWGNYVHERKIWNTSDTTTAPSDTTFGEYAVFVPHDTSVNPVVIEVVSGINFPVRYILNFELTDYYKLTSISFNQDDIDQYFTPNGVTITNGPNILMADDISQTYEFGYEVSTSSGPRYIIDKYYR